MRRECRYGMAMVYRVKDFGMEKVLGGAKKHSA